MPMENGSDFKPPVLTKRAPSKMQTPWCSKCAKHVNNWLYHQHGHSDGTPLIILNCHGETLVLGCKPERAEHVRQVFSDLYLSGKTLYMGWTTNGSDGSTNQGIILDETRREDDGGSSGNDTSGIEAATPRGIVVGDKP